ncbi:MAG: type I polyketide synthase [Brachybacterium sp.]|nr:type I polyketide synthase [Brachybacterium sp.]
MDTNTHRKAEPIAIVGIGCELPGGADSPAKFWDLLCNAVDASCTVPADRWDARKFYDPDPGKLGKMSTTRGGFLNRIDGFDAPFFGISPREAVWLDPQQRLLLKAAWEAVEDAGESMDALAGTDVGVFIGGFTLDYKLLQNYGVQSRYELAPNSATGMMMTMLSNRLSHAYDLRGPSMSVDTACSGSLVAIHLAAQAIWNQECSQALAGGVNVILAPNMTIAESKGGFLSPDGRCKTFDASANGYARGEGAGVLLLKPLSTALADEDPIYALIRGTAVSQDGHTNGITVPNGDAQEAAMRAAYERAGVMPGEVQYVEAHGTGTPLGDPIEAGAIGRVAAAGRGEGGLLVGSVKTNIGHLEAAAGVAGVIKTSLALKYGTIPAHLHLNAPNPNIDFDELGIRVPREQTPWPTADVPRYAGVNSFGFGGTNAHVVLEGPPALSNPPRQHRAGPQLLTLSARSDEALSDFASSMRAVLSDPGADLGDIAYSASLRRAHHDHRLAIVASSPDQAKEHLSAFCAQETSDQAVNGRVNPGVEPKVAFVFSGMGPQWWAMGRELLETEPVFRDAVVRCDRELEQYTGWSLMDEFTASQSTSRMGETEVAQPANFALQVGLHELWRSWGVAPAGIVGHSAGEAAAQYAAGVLTFEEAVRVIYTRSSLQQRSTGQGRMLAVGMTSETLEKAVRDAGPTVSVAAVNSPSAVTLSGEGAVLDKMAADLETFGVFHRFLDVRVPYHSHFMDPLREEILAGLADLQTSSANTPLYSTVTGSRIDGRNAKGQYWWQNVRASVLFAATIENMIDDGYTHFVEVSPHPVLASSMREILASANIDSAVVPSLKRGGNDREELLGSLGQLHCHGVDVDFAALHPDGGRLVKLPTYPWQLKRYWNESAEAAEDRHYDEVHPLLGQQLNAAHPTWEIELNLNRATYLADHQVQGTAVVPAAAMIEMMLTAATEVYGEGVYALKDMQLSNALVLSPSSDSRVRTTLYPEEPRIEIASFLATSSGERRWTVHAQARLGLHAPRTTDVNLSEAMDACSTRIGRSNAYARTAELGLEYGPAFQAVREVRTGGGSTLTYIRGPEEVAAGTDDYLFHPVLIDAAFQGLLVASVNGDTADGASTVPYLPVSIGSIQVLGAPAEDMVAVARPVTTETDHIVSDIDICDLTGKALVQIRDFRARALDAAGEASLERLDRGLLELIWEESRPQAAEEQVQGDEEKPSPDSWAVFVDDTGVGWEVARQLKAAGGHVVCVQNEMVSDLVQRDDGCISLDAANAEHYPKLVEVLTKARVSGIVHLWSLSAELHSQDSAAALEETQVVGASSAFHLVKAIGDQQDLRIWFATRGAHRIAGSPAIPAVAQAPLWGLGRVIGHQEFANLWGGIYDLDPAGHHLDQAQRLVDGLLADPGEDQVAFRGESRFVARLRHAEDLKFPFPVQTRPDGSYLVTGGFGALGLLVAEFLVENGARDLVLMSRSAPPQRRTWEQIAPGEPFHDVVRRLAALEAQGATVRTAAVDITDSTSLQAWCEAHRASDAPPIVGVVNVAGVVDDELLIRMSEEKFTRVLRPKLLGGWNLHQVFSDPTLDFFVLFSSAGSVITSPGQGNYASGNAFIDSLAHYRRSLGLPAQSIGWGPWSVGMVQELQLEQLYERRGIELITPARGKQILGRLLHQKGTHLIAMAADWSVASEAAFGANIPAMYSTLVTSTGSPAGSTEGNDATLEVLRQLAEPQRQQFLSDHIRATLARVLGLDVGEVDVDVALSQLGLDSIMAIEMKNRIDVTLQVDLHVLDLLQSPTVTSLATDIASKLDLSTTSEGSEEPELDESGSEVSETVGAAPGDIATEPGIDELEALIATLPKDELEVLLRELESQGTVAHD